MENKSKPDDNSKQAKEERFIRLERLKESFFKQYPTDGHCWLEVFKKSNPDKKTCSDCGSENLLLLDDGRKINCLDCNSTKRLTSGTFFHRVREIRAWFGAIWLMEQGEIFSASWFHKAFDIAYSTAWMILNKLSMVLRQSVPDDAPEVHSSLFISLFGRRSRETPAREHPSAEQREVERQSDRETFEGWDDRHTKSPPDKNERRTDEDWVNRSGSEQKTRAHQDNDQASMSRSSADNGHDLLDIFRESKHDQTEPLEDKVLSLLSNKPIHAEELSHLTIASPGDLSAVLMILEIQGLIKRLPGEFYVRNAEVKEQFDQSAENLNNTLRPKSLLALAEFKQCVKLIFHRISRKYLQLFIYKYWCQLDRKRWRKGSLIEACLQSDFIEDHEVLTFVSPINVLFPARSAKLVRQR